MASTGPGSATEGQPVGGGEIRLYEKWRKIYPLWVKGGFQTYRRIVLVILLFVFYVSPWLTWNGQPAVWFNLPERKFVVLWATFWPQEFVLLSWLLIISAFSLFFFTVMAGRIWCGWACPQTVWTLCYVWIEKLIEGDRSQRLRLDRGAWNAARIRKKAIKYTLWSAMALSISVTFVGYFVPIRVLLPKIATLDLLPWEQFWLLFPALASFVLSGVLREQVCFHMCPYARFQSVMFDKDTLIISYDEDRGEPRGSRPRNTDPAERGQGSCVDCQLCVSVCPTGIDIRKGLQYECIGCAACIDVCNDVMEKIGDAPDLIRYSSEHHDKHEGRTRVRPRLMGYGAVLTAMILAFTWTISHRVPLALDVIRDRNRLFREHWDGSVENVYTLKIMNREQRDRTYRIRAESALPLELKTQSGTTEFHVVAGALESVPVRLVAGPGSEAERNTPVEFVIETIGEPSFTAHHESRFLRPESGGGGR
jgi:cytochrome c oxidase accessory protein FixG